MAEPHPKVLNLTSSMTCVSGLTLIWSRITSPHCYPSRQGQRKPATLRINGYVQPVLRRGPHQQWGPSCLMFQHCGGGSSLRSDASATRVHNSLSSSNRFHPGRQESRGTLTIEDLLMVTPSGNGGDCGRDLSGDGNDGRTDERGSQGAACDRADCSRKHFGASECLN